VTLGTVRRRRPQISLLVPFQSDSNTPQRQRIWRWVRDYWQSELPDAEIVVGQSHGEVFSKTEAVNDAANRARGRIFVILDSDCYIPGSVIRRCVDQINDAERRGHSLWFIPFRHLYRLTESVTEIVLGHDPRDPPRFPTPPDLEDVESTLGSAHGHRFGALIQIMSRRAFFIVGGMDPRFRGWGGEDIAFVRALDTLYGNHKTTDNDVLHLWHPKIGVNYEDRMWQGQVDPKANERLSVRYKLATGDREMMQRLVNEAHDRPLDYLRLAWERLQALLVRFRSDD
jgi:predicted glycosyltransferase involved in capsule biosynthesis